MARRPTMQTGPGQDPAQAEAELQDLHVKVLAVVDTPANLTPFLTIKAMPGDGSPMIVTADGADMLGKVIGQAMATLKDANDDLNSAGQTAEGLAQPIPPEILAKIGHAIDLLEGTGAPDADDLEVEPAVALAEPSIAPVVAAAANGDGQPIPDQGEPVPVPGNPTVPPHSPPRDQNKTDVAPADLAAGGMKTPEQGLLHQAHAHLVAAHYALVAHKAGDAAPPALGENLAGGVHLLKAIVAKAADGWLAIAKAVGGKSVLIEKKGAKMAQERYMRLAQVGVDLQKILDECKVMADEEKAGITPMSEGVGMPAVMAPADAMMAAKALFGDLNQRPPRSNLAPTPAPSAALDRARDKPAGERSRRVNFLDLNEKAN